jgi:hypothetical protein
MFSSKRKHSYSIEDCDDMLKKLEKNINPFLKNFNKNISDLSKYEIHHLTSIYDCLFGIDNLLIAYCFLEDKKFFMLDQKLNFKNSLDISIKQEQEKNINQSEYLDLNEDHVLVNDIKYYLYDIKMTKK